MRDISTDVKAAFSRAVSAVVRPNGILLGYSGGADSSALLYLLKEYCTEQGIYLCAMHVHHGIRGTEADRDAELCRSECERLGVTFLPVHADIPRLAAKSGQGLEEAARDFRYRAFLDAVHGDSRLDCIATAHNADDSMETVLFHLVRGTGIDGLCGIPPVRVTEGVRIIRPLLDLPKSTIEAYCRENGINYIFDSTNADTVYTRNYIRRELMPAMRQLNPSLHAAMMRMMANLAEDRAYLQEAADRFMAECCVGTSMDAKKLADAPGAMASRAIAAVYARLSDRMPERVHIDAVRRLAEAGREGASVSLPDGVRAVYENGQIHLTREAAASAETFLYPLTEGINLLKTPDFAVLVSKNTGADESFEKDNEYLKNIYKLSIQTLVNSDKIKGGLCARSRRDGDSYVFGGMTRRLKKLYNDRGLCAAERRRLPVFCDDTGIVWVPGFAPADRVREASANPMTIIYYFN